MLFYERVKVLPDWNLNLCDLELLEGWGEVKPGEEGQVVELVSGRRGIGEGRED